MSKLNPWITEARRKDRQYGAAIMLLETMGRGGWVQERGIDKSAMLEASREWSRSEQILGMIAVDLLDSGCVRQLGYTPPGMGEICETLDPRRLRLVMQAMAHSRGWQMA